MPYKNRAQQKAFHAMEARGEISTSTVDEWDKKSKGKKLPPGPDNSLGKWAKKRSKG